MAHLYGIETAALENARVLELGCETAGNLLPFALAYPNAHVVGVDLWPENIQHGQKLAQDIGAKNLELHNKLFTEIDQDFGTFDYIIVHDEFTWAPSFLREAILRICRENLSPLGIAYISYNTYPGWKAGDTLRDAMQLHNHSAGTMEEVLAGAAAMLNPMSDGLANHNPQAASLKAAVERINQHPDYYLNGEFLQATAASFYFIEFAETAAQAGLAYVGDAEPQSEMSVAHGQNVQLNHSLISLGQPKLMKQQYLDFAVGREFRRSLFLHQERAVSILNAPDLDRLADLNWAACLKQGIFNSASGQSTRYFNPSGHTFAITDEVEIRICHALANVWPASLSYENLVASAQDIEAWLKPEHAQHATEDIQRALENLFKLGALHYSLDDGPYNHAKNHALQPFIDLNNFAQSSNNESISINGFNLWHAALQLRLTPLQGKLLEKINGSLSAKKLLNLAADTLQSEPTDTYTDPSALEPRDAADSQAAQLADLMGALRAQGALLGSRTAWLELFQTLLGTDLLPSVNRLQYLNPYLTHLHASENQSSESNFLLKGEKPATANTKELFGQQPKPEAVNTFNKIQALRRLQRFSEAEPIAHDLTAKYPYYATSWHILGIILGEVGETAQSVSPLFKALSLQPRNTSIYADLSAALQLLNEMQCAETVLRYALGIDRSHIPNWLNLGNLLRSQDKTSLAEICYRNALITDPADPGALNNLSTVLGDQGNLAESIECLRKVINAQPDNFAAYSNLLFMLSQYADITPTDLFKEHRAFGRRVEKNIKKQTLRLDHKNLRDPQKVLRLGFVSGDLRNHAVASFIAPIWESFNKREFELYAYSNTPSEDSVSQRLKAHVKSWKKVRSLSDQELAKQIQQDEIDILFDLSGHTAHNRLPMFAIKPAPIQISWIGYPGTTGLKAMDYYLADNYWAPEGVLDDQFSEKLLRIPCVAPFQSAVNAPNINSLPALKIGYITFGSFNRISKINNEVITTWCQILQEIPDAHLVIGHMHGSTMKRDVLARFEKFSISPERLILRERTNMHEYLKLHHQIDLMLDAFPYGGGTTTHHALQMGVPTLTLAGQTLAARAGASLMTQVGLNDFIANGKAQYIQKAAHWSNNLSELEQIRTNMRSRIATSPLDSSAGIAKSLENALRTLWSHHCSKETPASPMPKLIH